MIWPIFWITVMTGLVLATAIAAFRERGTRAKALKAMGPQTPLAQMEDNAGFEDQAGFEAGAAVDAFGTDQGEFEAFDENAFK